MFRPLQQSTQKLLSLTGHVKCTAVSPVCSFVIIIWKYARTKLCILQFIVENVVRNTQRNVWLSGDINQFNALVHVKKGIYKAHCVCRRGRVWGSASVLVVNICPVLIESSVILTTVLDTTQTPYVFTNLLSKFSLLRQHSHPKI